ncbi:hypothetical protein AVEN_47267-1 [Araneus ventricosus]|uniref:Uncharacterized protein n=1 Tax=Araneus ventricosus TaxID=182803 RepID=A0A4Y2GTF6_ARAVE|nr:hypothetical protein AVEN_47267-1 [Araneus ventricosus]
MQLRPCTHMRFVLGKSFAAKCRRRNKILKSIESSWVVHTDLLQKKSVANDMSDILAARGECAKQMCRSSHWRHSCSTGGLCGPLSCSCCTPNRLLYSGILP